jgi:lipopolysaccharide/colanic/teichoic acid biosynthesis glycosyltransferase
LSSCFYFFNAAEHILEIDGVDVSNASETALLPSLTTLLNSDVQVNVEFFQQRERHFNKLDQSPYHPLWHNYFANFGRRRVRLSLWAKRLFDFMAALCLVTLFSPVLIALVFAIKTTSPGPVFYKSLRVGRYGKPFYMMKFRSMVANADAQRAALREETEQQAQLFKLKSDPRVTKVGAFIRKYSLDELPQLFNVLRGEMSLVGPRPFAPDDARLFEDPYTLRFEAIPGMTGLWQVSGRSDLDFRQLCKLDLTYTFTWSFIKDLVILFRTIPAVLGKSGAC